jgi:hypothetical protein
MNPPLTTSCKSTRCSVDNPGAAHDRLMERAAQPQARDSEESPRKEWRLPCRPARSSTTSSGALRKQTGPHPHNVVDGLSAL